MPEPENLDLDMPEPENLDPDPLPQYTRVGWQRFPRLHPVYLAPSEQAEITRVAGGNPVPAQQLAGLIDSLFRYQKHVYWAWLTLVIGASCLVLSSWLPVWLNIIGLLLFVGPLIYIALYERADERNNSSRGRSTAIGLVYVLRIIEQPRLDVGRTCRALGDAANRFYGEYRKPSNTSRIPRRYRPIWENEAAAGARAIASQAERLRTDPPDTEALSDDIRRAIIRVVGGFWKQVSDIEIAPAEFWAAPGIVRRFGTWLREDSTPRLLAAIAAILAIIAAVFKLWT